jgi:hypothetical protein
MVTHRPHDYPNPTRMAHASPRQGIVELRRAKVPDGRVSKSARAEQAVAPGRETGSQDTTVPSGIDGEVSPPPADMKTRPRRRPAPIIDL